MILSYSNMEQIFLRIKKSGKKDVAKRKFFVIRLARRGLLLQRKKLAEASSLHMKWVVP